MLSGVVCYAEACPGYLLPRLPTLLGGPWQCQVCRKTVGHTAVAATVRTVLDNIATSRQESNQVTAINIGD